MQSLQNSLDLLLRAEKYTLTKDDYIIFHALYGPALPSLLGRSVVHTDTS